MSSSVSQLQNDLPFKPDDDDYVIIETGHIQSNQSDRILSSLPIPIAPKKNLLWQIDYKSVPYYIRSYNNQLFVCDKYGSILFTEKPLYCEHHKTVLISASREDSRTGSSIT